MSRILELGCGPAHIWRANAHRVPPGWEIILTDLSPGMLEEARRTLSEVRRHFDYQVVDARSIPFEDRSFDAIIAIMVLHHVSDLDRAIAEIHRALRPGGRFYAAAPGMAHMRELDVLIRRADPDYRIRFWGHEFNLERGADKLSRWFSEVAVHRYDDSLMVTEVQPLLDYVWSMTTRRPFGERWSEFVRLVESEMAAKGSVRITKDVGLLEARKASLTVTPL